jgi:hypothetical protein
VQAYDGQARRLLPQAYGAGSCGNSAGGALPLLDAPGVGGILPSPLDDQVRDADAAVVLGQPVRSTLDAVQGGDGDNQRADPGAGHT